MFTRDFNLVNFEVSKKLVNMAITAKVSKIVVMSSNSPVGCNPTRDHLFTEESLSSFTWAMGNLNIIWSAIL